MQRKTLSLFWKFSRFTVLQRNLSIFFPILAVTVNVIVAPYILSLFLDKLQKGGITFDNSWGLILTYALLIFIGEVFIWRFALYFTWTYQINGQRELYLAIFRKLSTENLAFHSDRFGGSLVSQSTKIVGAFERFWDMIIWNIIPMATTVFGSIIVMILLGLWQYGLFILLYSIVFVTVVIFGSRFLTERNRTEASTSTKTSGFLADAVTNISTIKAFGKEDHENKLATHRINDWHNASTRLKWGVIGTTGVFAAFYAMAAIAAFIFAVFAAESQLVSIGMIYLIFVYALNINRQLWEINNITRNYNRIIGDSHEMTEILDMPYRLTDKSVSTLSASKGVVEFKDVSFTHDYGKGESVFSSFDLHVPAGQRIGLVGHSGSGKTTLTRVLLRFSDIQNGTITIDGQDISEVTQQSVHESIAYVPQEPLLFHRSLADNISYGRPDATDEEIVEAAKKAHAYEFIQKLQNGMKTLVGERGIKLSGGQRQRIAIARAILKDAPILVLDEATSALDSESEKLIQDSLGDLMKGRTSIVIAHRLSTIAKLDRIVVLEQGKVVEDGTHSELLKKNGVYARLWSHQSGGFIEE